MKCGEVESVEEWEKFTDIVIKCTNNLCGMRRVSEQRRKGSELWNEVEIWLPMTDTGHRQWL